MDPLSIISAATQVANTAGGFMGGKEKVPNQPIQAQGGVSLVDIVNNYLQQVAAAQGGVPAMASGGIVTDPTLALIGEQGPEAVIPLRNA